MFGHQEVLEVISMGSREIVHNGRGREKRSFGVGVGEQFKHSGCTGKHVAARLPIFEAAEPPRPLKRVVGAREVGNSAPYERGGIGKRGKGNLEIISMDTCRGERKQLHERRKSH